MINLKDTATCSVASQLCTGGSKVVLWCVVWSHKVGEFSCQA